MLLGKVEDRLVEWEEACTEHHTEYTEHPRMKQDEKLEDKHSLESVCLSVCLKLFLLTLFTLASSTL
jgi:hypothetical protein